MKSSATLRMAASATLHCLIGCAIGELVGVTIGTHTGIGSGNTVLLAATLSFISGYIFSVIPIIRTGMKFWSALKLIFAADTVSILTMTIVDNICMLLIPGAFDKDLSHPVYWLSRIIAMSVAFLAAWPVNYYLLANGRGHALHDHHGSHTNENLD
ncbi:MAG: rane protein [Candidatus Saccharibacteria bacterium]|nr:rane protein [Candidatus Saccharibacteria bacterium]